jgi:peptidoglycan DL-endopeptidase CwlO
MSSIGSVGSVSFWQQDQNYWTQVQQNNQTLSQNSTVISQMFGASTTLATGLASIANQTALDRANTALTAAVQSALSASSASSSSSTSTSSTASSTTSASSTPAVTFAAPATGTGTVPLTSGTSLPGLGFLTRGNFTVSDGTYTTTYQSTGSDTVGNLISALNANAPGNAQVTAYLNGSGNLVIASKNLTDTVSVSGDYASALGFGSNNSTFTPTAPSSAATSTPSASSASGTSTGSSSSGSSSSTSSTGASASPPSGIPLNSAFALQTGGTAELLLASNGSSGSLVNLLA